MSAALDYEREEVLDLGYTPRQQFLDFHARSQRWAVIVAHRRAGKTVACVLDLIDSALRCTKERPRFAYVAPLYRQAKQVAWDYCKQYGLRVPGAIASESELKVDFPNGGQVRLYGADNPDSLRGIYLDGVILDEAADMSPKINEVLRPTLSDRIGWCCWIGTPKGQNDFYDLVYGSGSPKEDGSPPWPGAKADSAWFFKMLKASETGLLADEELASAASQLTPEQYAQEYECSFTAAILGAYYGREMEAAEAEGRIRANVYDRTLQVHTAWDLGSANATAIWFYQQSGHEIRVIDYYQAQNQSLQHFMSLLQARAGGKGSPNGYVYGSHHLPHDVRTKVLGMDKTRLATLQGLGMQNIKVVDKFPLDDGINAVRRILPRCFFERDRCAEGIKALRQYRREWDDIRKCFYEKPEHDWSSDAADAFRYLAVGLRERRLGDKSLPKRDTSWIY